MRRSRVRLLPPAPIRFPPTGVTPSPRQPDAVGPRTRSALACEARGSVSLFRFGLPVNCARETVGQLLPRRGHGGVQERAILAKAGFGNRGCRLRHGLDTRRSLAWAAHETAATRSNNGACGNSRL